MTGRRPFCYAHPTCVRAYLHTGDHLPGCRNCGETGHTEPHCTNDPFYAPIGDDVTPTDGPWMAATTPAFPTKPKAEPLQDWERDLIARADDNTPVRDVTADENVAQGE